MTITPEKKWEIEVEMAKFLRHLMTEEKERSGFINTIDIKKFDLNMHPQKVSVSPR